jgi:hypothetical protein
MWSKGALQTVSESEDQSPTVLKVELTLQMGQQSHNWVYKVKEVHIKDSGTSMFITALPDGHPEQ